jgi:hypothetical protein
MDQGVGRSTGFGDQIGRGEGAADHGERASRTDHAGGVAQRIEKPTGCVG